ncbi:Hypothetical protein FKW44_011540 [Caligus rogercresseyi]|uniref:Uncharacterized protein n=1 Tax=Caligus rogercresseyi TaxID=217165 RepID=A0A7T8K9S2_CALRO|nr:Hypothetical protein FKW44_011540 [Caligus rogercresseyi]
MAQSRWMTPILFLTSWGPNINFLLTVTLKRSSVDVAGKSGAPHERVWFPYI